jgi:flavodoxin
MSEILVISYSDTGASRRLAQMLCKQQGWPMAEISEIYPRCGLSGQINCLLDSWMRRRPSICYTGPPPNEYDAVVLVAPVWSWRLAGPVRSFVKLMNEQLPDLAIISVAESWETRDAITELSSIIGYFPVSNTTFTPDEINDESCLKRLQTFGEETQAAEHQQILIQNHSIESSTSQFEPLAQIGQIIIFLCSQTGK